MIDRFYVGTEKKILDISCPRQEIPRSFNEYQSSGLLINGSPYKIGSGHTGKQQAFSFGRNIGTADDIEVINGLMFGKYGTGWIYYCDPFARNILPHYLSIPATAVSKKPFWCRFATAALIDTPDNGIGLPLEAASIIVPDDRIVLPFKFVVPDDCDLAVSIKGVPSADISFVISDGTTDTTCHISNTSQLWDSVVPNDGSSRLWSMSIAGAGSCVLYGVSLRLTNKHATVYSVGLEQQKFLVGMGQSGCKISSSSIQENLYALDQPFEEEPFTLELVDVEFASQ